MSARSRYFAAWRKKTPTVVRSWMASGSIASAAAGVALDDVALLDRLDGERERARGNADRDPVPLLVADQGATHR